MKWVLLEHTLEVGITDVIGPFDTKAEADQASYDLGVDTTVEIFEMLSEDEYREGEMCSS